MNILSNTFNVLTTAASAAEFGKKGIAMGAGVGVASIFAGEIITDDEDSYKNAAIKGFTSGVIQSGFSSAQEIYAFNNPNSVQALSSINTTTTASAAIDRWDKITNPSTYKDKKTMVNSTVGNLLRPEDKLIDLARNSMIRDSDFVSDMNEILSSLEKNFNHEKNSSDGTPNTKPLTDAELKKRDKKGFFNTIKDLTTMYFESVKDTIDIADGNITNKWITANEDGSPITARIRKANPFGLTDDIIKSNKKWVRKNIGREQRQYIREKESKERWQKRNPDLKIDESKFQAKEKIKRYQGKAKPVRRDDTYMDVTISSLESMQERIAKFFEAQDPKMLDGVIKAMSEVSDSEIDSVEALTNYIRNIEPGAVGTTKELERAKVYGKDSNPKKRLLGLLYEEMNGSPFWSRQVTKDIKNGNSTLEKLVEIIDATGNKSQVPFAEYQKTGLKQGQKYSKVVNKLTDVKGKPGGKVGRNLALAGDIIVGGLANALLFTGEKAIGDMVAKPFKLLNGNIDNLGKPNIKSNNAINPVY